MIINYIVPVSCCGKYWENMGVGMKYQALCLNCCSSREAAVFDGSKCLEQTSQRFPIEIEGLPRPTDDSHSPWQQVDPLATQMLRCEKSIACL